MILRALYDLARREELMGDPDFEWKPVAWRVRVDDGGRLLGIEDNRTTPPEGSGRRKPRPLPNHLELPREPGRTSGDRAFFLYDKSEYAFGVDPTAKRPAAKLAARFALFRERAEQCLESTGDPGVAAVVELLRAIAEGRQAVELPADCAANDLFAFVYAPDVDLPVTSRPAVRSYWKQLRASPPEAGDARLCLVTGEMAEPVDKHVPLKNVPGGVTSGVALVSVNANAFESHGWRGNDNATVSREAAETYATALQRLLSPAPPDPQQPGLTLPRRNLRLASDTTVCYWAAGESDLVDLLDDLLEANPERVGDLYRSVWRGKRLALGNHEAFYALVLGGAQGRAMVRDWFESTVAEVGANLARHFADLATVRLTPPPRQGSLPPAVPLRALLASLAPPGRGEVPGPLAGQIVVAALRGTLYPFSILQRAVLRSRAEAGRSGWSALERRDARASLLKAVLNRRRRTHPDATDRYPEVKPQMDPDNTNPGYNLGRLMAVIERIQELALGKDVNATVVDRFFSAASASPRAVFYRLLKNARHHVHKIKDDEKKNARRVSLEKKLDELVLPFKPETGGFPPYLDLEQQGLFVLGYHHQRHALFQRHTDRQAETAEEPTAAA